MSKRQPRPTNLPSEGSASWWQWPRKKLTRRQGPSDPDGSPSGKPDHDSAKEAHARRREQVRRAQRNHRQRKEMYIRSLEEQIIHLRNKETEMRDFIEARIENGVLKEIMITNGLPLPGKQLPSCLAQVSVVGAPGTDQHLRVNMSDFPDPRYHPYYGFARYPTPSVDSTLEIDQLSISSHRRHDSRGSYPEVRREKGKGSAHDHRSATRASPRPPVTISHPYGLDSTQAGIDFVLSLEQPCLQHTRGTHGSDEPSGHTLTVQASLLAHAPRNLEPSASWQIPTGELERLLELSTALELDGELTPVQAWNRIRKHPGFYNLTAERLRIMRDALLGQVRCYGFGAVIDELTFTEILQAILSPSAQA